MTSISSSARALGRIGGKTKSKAKAKASRRNGRLGGRPVIDIQPLLDSIRDEGNRLIEARNFRRQYPSEFRKAQRLRRINAWKDDTGREFVEIR